MCHMWAATEPLLKAGIADRYGCAFTCHRRTGDVSPQAVVSRAPLPASSVSSSEQFEPEPARKPGLAVLETALLRSGAFVLPHEAPAASGGARSSTADRASRCKRAGACRLDGRVAVDDHPFKRIDKGQQPFLDQSAIRFISHQRSCRDRPWHGEEEIAVILEGLERFQKVEMLFRQFRFGSTLGCGLQDSNVSTCAIVQCLRAGRKSVAGMRRCCQGEKLLCYLLAGRVED